MDLSVHYCPFSYSTYSPVTAHNIEEQALISMHVRAENAIPPILGLISEVAAGSMDEKNIRLKLGIKGDTYIFDKHGDGLLNGKKHVRLNVSGFEKLISDQGISLKFAQ